MAPAARARRAGTQDGSGSWRELTGQAAIRSPVSLPSPASASSGTSSLLFSRASPAYWQRILRRNAAVRAVGGGSALFVLFWLVLLAVGAFDPNLHVGPHIDERTFQVLPNGDPKRRQQVEYTKPPNYWEFVANWNKPSFDLLANSPPSQRMCDKSGPLLFIGIFTHAGGVGRRQIIRAIFEPDLHPEGYRIQYKFIVGRPPDDDWRYLLDHEQQLYHDIAVLEDVEKDNIDEGKTVDYFKWLVKTLPDPKPQFVMKMDDDTFMVMPNVIKSLSNLDCGKAIYWGTTQGANEGMFGKYMRGLCYGMSWPLASWIGSSNVTTEWATGIEDARMGRIVQLLDPKTEPVQWVDHGWKMGDWDQMKVDENIMAFHWLKMDHWMPMVKRKALGAFADLYTQEDVETYDPRVLLTLPRLSILYGVFESIFPVSVSSAGQDTDAQSLQAPLEVFLPRLCRALPHKVICEIRKLSPAEVLELARRLCVVESAAEVQDDEISMSNMFKAVAGEADGSGPANKGGRYIKLMKKVLKSYIATAVDGHTEGDEEDEYMIARAFLTVAGLQE